MAIWASVGRGPKPYRPVRRNSKTRPVTQVLTENPADRIQFDRRGEKIPSHTASPANRNETTSAVHHKIAQPVGQGWGREGTVYLEESAYASAPTAP
jgi:hypothetical protein